MQGAGFKAQGTGDAPSSAENARRTCMGCVCVCECVCMCVCTRVSLFFGVLGFEFADLELGLRV